MKNWYFHGQYKVDDLGFNSFDQSSSTISKEKILICSVKYRNKMEKNVNNKAVEPYLGPS